MMKNNYVFLLCLLTISPYALAMKEVDEDTDYFMGYLSDGDEIEENDFLDKNGNRKQVGKYSEQSESPILSPEDVALRQLRTHEKEGADHLTNDVSGSMTVATYTAMREKLEALTAQGVFLNRSVMGGLVVCGIVQLYILYRLEQLIDKHNENTPIESVNAN